MSGESIEIKLPGDTSGRQAHSKMLALLWKRLSDATSAPDVFTFNVFEIERDITSSEAPSSSRIHTQTSCLISLANERSRHNYNLLVHYEIANPLLRLARNARLVVEGSCAGNVSEWNPGPDLSSYTVPFAASMSAGFLSAPKFLAEIDALSSSAEESDDVLDLIYDKIDLALVNSQFNNVDAILALANIDKMGYDVIIALLSTTLRARQQLTNRSIFLGLARERIIAERGADTARDLLGGLE